MQPIGSGITGGASIFDRGVIVAGTDTGVGKTFVTAVVLCSVRRRGLRAVPMKPVQTGCLPDRRAPDLDFCLEAAGLRTEPALYDLLAPYRFLLPASPHLAAAREGATVSLEHVVRCVREVQSRGLIPIIEAAGGLLVPWTEECLQIDALMRLDLPWILVARAGLGTLNHTLLSVEALQARGGILARIYLNDTRGSPGLIEEDNARILRQFLPRVDIRQIPFTADPSPASAAAIAAEFEPG